MHGVMRCRLGHGRRFDLWRADGNRLIRGLCAYLWIMDERLISSCHRALLRAAESHPSPLGYELLVHPMLRATVTRFEEEAQVSPGSFGTLVGARRVIFTVGAEESFAVFCLTHLHRLAPVFGAPGSGVAEDEETITQ